MTVIINPVEKIDELFCHYPGQTDIQPCYMYLNTIDGKLSCAYDPEIGPPRSMSLDEYHRLVLTWQISCLTKTMANQLLEDAKPIATRILNGSDARWDGNNYVGVQTTQDAIDAIEEMEQLCDEYQNTDDILYLADPGDWYTDGDEAALTWSNLTIDSIDEDIRRAAALTVSDALAGNAIMDVDDVIKYLTRARDDQRKLREEMF